MQQTLYRDFLFLTMMAFVAMVIIILPYLNPPTQQDPGDITAPGNVIVQITWNKGNNDVDLWVWSEKEYRPIGYSNKGGFVWNLLRDDLGSPDEDINYENSFSRGIYPGEYIVNVHCYRCHELPVSVHVEVKVKKSERKVRDLKTIAATNLTLDTREEATAMRFKLDKDGNLIKGSLNHIFQPLRANTDGQGLGRD